MTTNEIGAKPASKEEFIAAYMVNRGDIRWIRSIFFDEKDKIDAILDCMERMTAKHEEEKAAMLQKIYDFGLLDKNERHEAALGWGKEGSDFYKGFIEGAKHVASSVAYQILTIPNCRVIDRATSNYQRRM